MDQLPFKSIFILTFSDILQDKNLFLDRNPYVRFSHNYQHKGVVIFFRPGGLFLFIFIPEYHISAYKLLNNIIIITGDQANGGLFVSDIQPYIQR